jgi:acyl-CoA thioesterase-1
MLRLLLLAALVLACERPASTPVRWSRPAVVFLGDSLTAGLGVEPGEAYPALLERRMKAAGFDFAVVNAGTSGDTTDQALARLERIARFPVAVLVVALGVNDAMRFRPPEQIRDTLARIVDRGRGAGALVVLAGMKLPLSFPPDVSFPPDYRRSFEHIYPQLAQRYGIPLVPFLLEGVAGNRALNQRDGLHPTAEGYRRVADVVWPVLEPALRSTAQAAGSRPR